MSDVIFAQALDSFEKLPSPGNLERSIGILARGGVELPRIRGWARETAENYGVLPYVQDFERMMAGAAKLRAEV
jgi:hypothetical protein